MNLRSRTAMTLLEVVLAIALVVLMMGSVYGFYGRTVAVRDRVVDRTAQVTAMRNVMRRITDELRCAKVYPFINIGLTGGEDEAQFITTMLPGPAAWVRRDVIDDAPPPEYDLQLVGYRLRTSEDEDEGGQVVVEGLERTCQRLQAVAEAEEGEGIEVAFLTPHVKFLRLQYWSGRDWAPQWNDKLPGAVEITLGFEPLPEETAADEYPYETFRRVVAIPAVAEAPRGTVIVNPGGGRRR